MFANPLLSALFFGLLTAVSLPLGAIVARFWVPRDRVLASLMAFGAGALLSALTIDLVGNALEHGNVWPLSGGAVLGGLLFVVLNQVVNNQGGFLRKSATTLKYLRGLKEERLKELFRSISAVPVFNELPPEEIAELVPYIGTRTFAAGDTVIREGEPGDSVFIVESGRVRIASNDTHVATLGDGDVLGEMALVTGEPRSATAVAETECRVWYIMKDDFDELLAASPHLKQAVSELAMERISNLQEQQIMHPDDARRWYQKAARNVDQELLQPTPVEIREAAHEHGGAPLAIWLGILLDGIPESLVIGASLVQAGISFSLLAGLFLSNFPEALSSSAAMRQASYGFGRILVMWVSLMLLTGLGALLGNLFFTGASHEMLALVEGIAAGAMLTMIAETMLPEAYHKGGTVTGLSTLLGFLVAILFKTLE